MTPTKLNWYGLRKLGFDEEALGLSGNLLSDQVAIEALCIRIEHAEHEGGLGSFGHFKNYVDLLWNNPDSGSMKRCVWNPWANRMFRKMLECNELSIAGCSCVSGDTRLLDPLTGREHTIKDLCGQGVRPWVQTLHGPRQADVPYLKGEETLYRYTLDNGSSFECTAKHILLTPAGWSFASEVRCGDLIHKYERNHLPTNSDDDHTGQLPDAHRCSEKVEGSTDRCSAYFRLCGEQLQSARDNAQELLPSQGGVQISNLSASVRLGVLSHESGHSHLCLSTDLSTCSVSPRMSLSRKHGLYHSDEGTSSPLAPKFRLLQPSHLTSILRRSFSKLARHFGHTQHKGCDAAQREGSESRRCVRCSEESSCLPPSGQPQDGCCQAPEKVEQDGHYVFRGREASWELEVSHAQVVSIENIGVHDFYDLNVPVEHHYFAEGAIHHNSAGKSDPAALYGVVRYSIDPTHTLVMMMSTTIQGAKKRVWKTLREYWESVNGLPGKALWSSNEIRGLNYRGDSYGTSSGIYLLAADQSNEKAALDKIIGIKAPRTGEPEDTYEALSARPEYADLKKYFDEESLRDLIPRLHNLSQDRIGRLILIIDEATGVSESILNAVNTNLKPGNVGHFQIICLGNPNLVYDTFGLFSKPRGGWDKVDLLNDDEWETATGGTCIRFNAENNPRIVEENERYSWMLRKVDIQEMERRYGRNSLFYHRMVLGAWCLNGEETGVYSPADIEMSGAKDTEVVWGFIPPTPVSFLDPAFTAGGDLAWATFGLLGIDFEGKKVLQLIDDVPIKTDPSNNTVPVNFQIVKGWKTECETRGVKPHCAAYDRSGGGIPFGDIVSVMWSPMVTGITFGGNASRRPVPGEKTPAGRPVLACEKFVNKSTEVWYGAHPLLRSHQIKGISDDLAKELCSRQHAKDRGGDANKICVENKRTYKDREGSSPDQSDSFLGLVDFCRDKHGLEPLEGTKIRAMRDLESAHGGSAWKVFRERARRLSKPRNFQKEQ